MRAISQSEKALNRKIEKILKNQLQNAVLII